jgi:hypothetical protein
VKQMAMSMVMVMGCQAGANTLDTSTTEQALGDVCNTDVPPVKSWKGGSIAPTSETTKIVMLKYPNQWRAYAVDPPLNKIHWIYSMTPSYGIKFAGQAGALDRDYISIRTPPELRCPPFPICGDDWLAAALGGRFDQLVDIADADVDTCYPQ